MKLSASVRGDPGGRPFVRTFVVGAGVGVVAGVLMAFQPIVALVFVAGLLLLAAVVVSEKAETRAACACGVLVAVGGVLALGEINSIVACSTTADFCGQANLWPLVFVAFAALGAGVAGGGMMAVRHRPG
jgi:hypothetical protein